MAALRESQSWRDHVRRFRVAYVVLASGLAITAVTTALVRRGVNAADEQRFTAGVDDATEAIRRRMQAYQTALAGVQGLFAASSDVTREEFRRYVEQIEIQRRYPGIQGLGFARQLDPEDIPAHEARVRAEGFPAYRVWPPGGRSSIEFLEPFDWRNQRAFGFDMLSEATRREAMERARDTGSPAASGRVTLVQEAGQRKQPGFLIYLPVYAGGDPADVAARRERLVGWVYAPFRAYDLMRGVQQESQGPIDLEIYDGASSISAARLLYDGDPLQRGAAAIAASRFARQVPLEVAGRRWTLSFSAGPSFLHASSQALPAVVLLAGLIVSVLLFSITLGQARARAHAETAERDAAFLAQASAELSRSLEPQATLDALAAVAVPKLADWCEIEALAGDGGDVVVGAQAAAGGGASIWHGPHSPARTDVPVRMHAWPLVAREQELGRMRLAWRRAPGEMERELAAELARMAGAALENAILYEQAQSAVRLRDEFISIASHELKTPLTSLTLQLQRLRRIQGRVEGEAGERAAAALSTAERQARRLSALITSLLDVSRIVNRKLQLELEHVDLAEVAREVSERLSEELALAGCRLDLRAPHAVVGRWDRLRLEQIATNLLSNAAKYGRGKPVHVHVEGRGDEAVLEVRDEGIGISPADAERIFGRFERAVSARHYGGLGMGLYIVQQIVDALGGRISVSSRPDEGSTFRVELPRGGPADELGPRPEGEPGGVRAE